MTSTRYLDERVALASRLLQSLADRAPIEQRDAPEIHGRYVWQPVRGGGALLVGADGGLLFADSSVSYSEHLAAYLAGKRTDPEAFASN